MSRKLTTNAQTKFEQFLGMLDLMYLTNIRTKTDISYMFFGIQNVMYSDFTATRIYTFTTLDEGGIREVRPASFHITEKCKKHLLGCLKETI